nr:MAG TPA: hypothetical protein [Caudoviricetes sp.]
MTPCAGGECRLRQRGEAPLKARWHEATNRISTFI